MNDKQLGDKEFDTRPSPEELEAYLHLSNEQIARLVLCLLIEEALKGQVASLLPDVRYGNRTAS